MDSYCSLCKSQCDWPGQLANPKIKCTCIIQSLFSIAYGFILFFMPNQFNQLDRLANPRIKWKFVSITC